MAKKMKRVWLLTGLIALTLAVTVSTTAMAAGEEESWTWGQDLNPGGQWEVTPTWDEYIPLDWTSSVLRHRDGATVTYKELEAEYAPLGRFSTYRFESSRSMAPYIDTDDLVFLSWSPVEVGLGDVIGTWQADCPFTHRVYSIAGDVGYRVRGDNQPRPDRCIVLQENVLYKVAGVAKDFYK